ncbi:MAG: LptA/OstA family protein [Maricaulaceae bacterium]
MARRFLFALVCAVIASPVALAQLISLDDDQIAVDADDLELLDDKGVAFARGNVDAIQGAARLRCDTLEVRFEKYRDPEADSLGDPIYAIATGNVFYITETETARGERAVYDLENDKVVFTGSVVVQTEDSVVTGERLEIDQRTGRNRMTGGATGRDAAPATRSRAVFGTKSDDES